MRAKGAASGLVLTSRIWAVLPHCAMMRPKKKRAKPEAEKSGKCPKAGDDRKRRRDRPPAKGYRDTKRPKRDGPVNRDSPSCPMTGSSGG